MGIAVLPENAAETLQVSGGRQSFTSTEDCSWRRPSDWLGLGSISASDNKFIGLLAITDDGSNFIALSAAGAYTVDWGDGTSTNHGTGTTAVKQYTYSSVSSGTASTRGYRQVLVTVTPQAGQTFTSLNLQVKHTQTGLNAYETKWLDIAIAGSSLSTITIGAITETVRLRWLERARILSSAVTTYAEQFANCLGLQDVSVASSGTVTSTASMFRGCAALQIAPWIDTASVSTTASMFLTCRSLKAVPCYSTAAVTDFTSTFSSCSALLTVPKFNTSAATTMSAMFSGCTSLKTVPLLATSAVTDMSSMFQNCSSLTEVPALDLSSVTTTSSMFNGCGELRTVPAFNTPNLANMGAWFSSCSSLATVPLMDTADVTNVNQTFSACPALVSVGLFDLTGVTTAPVSNIFTTATSLASGALSGFRFGTSYASCNLSDTGLESIFDNLGAAYGSQTVTISSNWGAPTPVSLSGTTTSGSTTVSMASTAGLSTGMEISGTGISDAVAVTLQDSGDTVTRTAHGLSNGDRIGVLTLNGAGGGIALNTPYYVVNKTANTFQVADTAGGSAKTITATPKFTSITSGSNTTDAASFTTASVTLTSGRLYVLSVENSHGTSATAISSITGGAGVPTFTSRVTTQFNSNLNRTSMWTAVPGSTYTGTLTINFGGTTQTGITWSLVEVVNVDTATTDGIVTTGSATGSGTTPAVNAAALGASTNSLFGAIGSLATSAVPVGRYTEMHDVTAATPTQGLQTIYQSAVSEALDRTISSTISSAAWGVCYVEIKAGTSTADGAGTINYSTTISSIVANTSVTLSVPASASGTITTSSAVLKRSKARIRGFTVSG